MLFPLIWVNTAIVPLHTDSLGRYHRLLGYLDVAKQVESLLVCPGFSVVCSFICVCICLCVRLFYLLIRAGWCFLGLYAAHPVVGPCCTPVRLRRASASVGDA